MADSFPTLKVFKAALSAPLARPIVLVKTILILAVAAAVPILYAVSQGINLEIIEQMTQPENAELATEYAVPLLLVYLLGAALLGPALAYTFNLWVRFGAYGPDSMGFPSVGNAISATLINMFKFFFILLLLGIALVVAFFVLSATGLAPGLNELAELSSKDDLAAITLANLLPSVIYLIIICVVYSVFSANLTRTALQSVQEGLEHPHTIDFAIVLFLLYLVVFVPVTLLSLLNAFWLSTVINYTLGLYIGFSIAVAHGLRYRYCVPQEQDIFE